MGKLGAIIIGLGTIGVVVAFLLIFSPSVLMPFLPSNTVIYKNTNSTLKTTHFSVSGVNVTQKTFSYNGFYVTTSSTAGASSITSPHCEEKLSSGSVVACKDIKYTWNSQKPILINGGLYYKFYNITINVNPNAILLTQFSNYWYRTKNGTIINSTEPIVFIYNVISVKYKNGKYHVSTIISNQTIKLIKSMPYQTNYLGGEGHLGRFFFA